MTAVTAVTAVQLILRKLECAVYINMVVLVDIIKIQIERSFNLSSQNSWGDVINRSL